MNDATILVPMPPSPSNVFLRGTETAGDGTPLLDRALFDQLAKEPVEGPSSLPVIPLGEYTRMLVTAVRFDLCDHNLPGPCTGEADGRLRLVFQPLNDGGSFDDIAFHAFYAVPFAEVSAMVKTMRDLASLQAQAEGPLRVSPALSSGNAEYRAKLKATVLSLGGRTKLIRLTMNAQPALFSQIRWVMRGVEKRGDTFASVTIPGVPSGTEEVITSGQFGFEGKPVADIPRGMSEAMDDQAFAAASDARKKELLQVLASAEDPRASAPDTVSCAACHVATPLIDERAKAAGIPETSIAGRFTSSYDLTLTGLLKERRVIRALGYVGQDPLISQRVVNDTAQVLTEIEQHFPR